MPWRSDYQLDALIINSKARSIAYDDTRTEILGKAVLRISQENKIMRTKSDLNRQLGTRSHEDLLASTGKSAPIPDPTRTMKIEATRRLVYEWVPPPCSQLSASDMIIKEIPRGMFREDLEGGHNQGPVVYM